ncbi:hypothetical protein BA724_10110 [Domibacillus iocasae]|uniref:Uncharacterized protein n=1 Tax=Domibacillus iocasae TaxID=1714016 RepID=A0A1E7DNI0_9BACI|nr:hypothetical protein BA724_10110 [Domibacillus iocasae]
MFKNDIVVISNTIGFIMNAGMTSLKHNMEQAAGSMNASKIDVATAKELAAFQNPKVLLDQPKLEQMQQALPADIQPVIAGMIETLRDSLSDALTTVFLSGDALVLIAFILVFFLREIPLRTSNKETGE